MVKWCRKNVKMYKRKNGTGLDIRVTSSAVHDRLLHIDLVIEEHMRDKLENLSVLDVIQELSIHEYIERDVIL